VDPKQTWEPCFSTTLGDTSGTCRVQQRLAFVARLAGKGNNRSPSRVLPPGTRGGLGSINGLPFVWTPLSRPRTFHAINDHLQDLDGRRVVRLRYVPQGK